MTLQALIEIPDSNKLFHDAVFMEKNKHISDKWIRIGELYPGGIEQPLLPPNLLREQFGQGNHYECFMLTALSTLVRFPDVIQNCFISRHVRRDGRYTFQFFRGKEWVKVEIDDYIPLDEDEVLYIRSPTKHWWPLLLEKAYAKFYSGYENLEGCTMQEAYHDLTGNPVLNIPMEANLAKAAGFEVSEGHYWLDLAQKIQSGQFVASVLTKDLNLEDMGMQGEQQYGVLEIFSMTGTSSVNDIVIHLYNPFEDDEFIYKGPLNSKDPQWTSKLRAKYNVDDERSIFLPLNTFLVIIDSMQLCYISQVDGDATYFDDEWKGETAGGNPTSVTWRKNPLYCVRNSGNSDVLIVVMIKQEDQRRFLGGKDDAKYVCCGMVLTRYTYNNPILSRFITGNNHKPVYKSLFLNSREVSQELWVPARSICYLLPSALKQGTEGRFTLAVYRIAGQLYNDIVIKKVIIPEMDWDHPARRHVRLESKQKDRVDFYVEQKTDIHILMHQLKPYVSPKTGGDAMAQDYMGMYLYDDSDRKIGGVHAATNFRETSIIHHLPRSGRYAISVTCPRGKGTVPALITVVGSFLSKVRLVDPPEEAGMFDDEDIIDEGDDAAVKTNPIDYVPINIPVPKITEVADSTTPFEDRRFMVDNRVITNDPWVHIGDLYPEGRTEPLLPDRLSREQFEKGEHFECCCLTAFATLVDHHPDVIRNLFVTKEVRRDGRYTFQFHRYGQWMRVEIDDRIPMAGQQTLFCRSPTHHWWPLLLEKACAKFYTLYQNLEGCRLQELYYDFTGQPVVSIPTDPNLARPAMYNVDEPGFWIELNESVKATALCGITKVDVAGEIGMQGEQAYGILGIVPTGNTTNPDLSDLLVMIYNPFVGAVYTGPMNPKDPAWTLELRSVLTPERHGVIYMPVTVFCHVFSSVQRVHIRELLLPSWHFNSEWGEGTNGGNPSLVTWRENPLYVVRNTSDEPLQIIAMIGQPDQRHRLHLLPQRELSYIQCGLVFAETKSRCNPLPTYLITESSHRILFNGPFVNFRDISSLITVPACSLCYLAPSGMFNEKGKFLLSYWYQKPADARSLRIERLHVGVARHLPAIAHLEPKNREKGRVDFVVKVPTDIHILLRQEKTLGLFDGVGAMTQDSLCLSLYDSNDRRIHGVTSTGNSLEMGIAHHLPAAGRYALSITCPRINGVVPSKVEIVAEEAAQVRITDPPDGAGDLKEVDLLFLDKEPEGVSIDDIPLYDDEVIVDLLAKLRKLQEDSGGNASIISRLEDRVNLRAHALAKQILGKDRHRYLPGLDLDLLKPLLDADRDYIAAEGERYRLKKDPRNAAKVRSIEEALKIMADVIAQKAKYMDLLFLESEPEGIPVNDIPLMEDNAFATMAMEHMRLKRDPAVDASKIRALEEMMNERAHELAMKAKNADGVFSKLNSHDTLKEILFSEENGIIRGEEDQFRRPNGSLNRNEYSTENVQDMVQNSTHELDRPMPRGEREVYVRLMPEEIETAGTPMNENKKFREIERSSPILEEGYLRHKKEELGSLGEELTQCLDKDVCEYPRKERVYLDPEPEGIPINDISLSKDEEFESMEAHLQKLCRYPERNGSEVLDMQVRMNDRAHELAKLILFEELNFLNDTYKGIPTKNLNLYNDHVIKGHVRRLRRARGKGVLPVNIRSIMDEIDRRACEIADELIHDERAFLDSQPEGLDLADVPLDSDTVFAAMEAERRRMLKGSCPANGDKDTVHELENEMNNRVHALALEQFLKMRDFMNQEPEGVSLQEISLNEDPVFRRAEVARYRMLKDPQHSPKEIARLEDVMNKRAHELAKAVLTKDRDFLDHEPLGVPIEELSLDTDEEFKKSEAERSRLKRLSSPTKYSQIMDIEANMNEHIYELAKEYLRNSRAFLDAEPEGVPLEDIPLECNTKFVGMEHELVKLRKDPNATFEKIRSLEEDLNKEAHDVAKELLRRERAFLEAEPFGVPLLDLPLNHDPVLNPMERKLRALRKDPKRNADEIHRYEDEIQNRVRAIAKDCVDKERSFLDPEPEGVLLGELPLDTHRKFRDMESELRQLLKQPIKNEGTIKGLKEEMNNCVHDLAKESLKRARVFLDSEPLGVPLEELLLNNDGIFRRLEKRYRDLKKVPFPDFASLRNLEDEMNMRARELADDYLRVERDFLDQDHEGFSLFDLKLDKDKEFREMEKKLRAVKRDPITNVDAITDLEQRMRARVQELVDRQLLDNRNYLPVEIHGVSVFDLPLNDLEFRALETQRYLLQKHPTDNTAAIFDLEKRLNNRAIFLADEYLRKDRAYLDPTPEGLPLDRIPLNNDKQFVAMEQKRRQLKKDSINMTAIRNLEKMLNHRSHELAKSILGWQDVEFHESNKHVAEEWPRICQLYPEGVNDVVVPEITFPSHVASAPGELGYLAPFIAALSRHPPLIQRLFESRTHPVNGRYSFIFYDPDSKPVRVDIDDRVPVNSKMEPKFTRVPLRSWYPLLLEKAYAKFVGGYSKLDHCTPHETLRDLTGRPVLHIPFDEKMAEALKMGDFRTSKFWFGMSRDLERGDVFTAMSNESVSDGIHALSSYAVIAVIDTVKQSNDPADIVIKLHNCYHDAPFYSGPLHHGDPNWTEELKKICDYNPLEEEFLYLPLPVFLCNFSSLQRCHVNCGDRLTAAGEWNEYTCGGNPKFTTFRNNPIYLVENKSSRPVTILAELRHCAPVVSDPDGVNHYHQTGLALMQSVQLRMPPTPLIAQNTHRFLQRGMMLDARELCSQMELPPSTVCYLIPYTAKRGCFGKFSLSIYPGMARVTLTPLRNAGLKCEPLMTKVLISSEEVEGKCVEFFVSGSCDVHVLLRQTHVTDPASVKKGDLVGEDEVLVTVYNEYGIKIASTANFTNIREQALVFHVPRGGRYSVKMMCLTRSKTGTCLCLLLIYVPRSIIAELVPVPSDAKPIVLSSRFSILPRSDLDPRCTTSCE